MLRGVNKYVYTVGRIIEKTIADNNAYYYWKNSNSVYLGCSKNTFKIGGWNSELDIMGKTDYDFAEKLGWQLELVEIIQAQDQKVILTRQPQTFEETILNKEGEAIVLSTIKFPIWDKQDNVVGVFGISLDISKRKKAEEWLAKTAHVTAVTDHMILNYLNIVHSELSHTLHVLSSLAQFMANQPLAPEQLACINQILQTKQQLSLLINQLLLLPPKEVSAMLMQGLSIKSKLH